MCSACVQDAERLWVSILGRAGVGVGLELLPVDENGLNIHHPGSFEESESLIQINIGQAPFV